jgi:hypothetical protein
MMCSEHCQGDRKGVIVKPRGLAENGADEFEYDDRDGYRYQEIWWLTKQSWLTTERTDFVAHGNEAQLAHTYGDVVLIASVGGHGNRQTSIG